MCSSKKRTVKSRKSNEEENTPETRTRDSRARAVCKRLFDKFRRESWKRYLTSINARTSMKEMWGKVRKMCGAPTPVVRGEDQELQRDLAVVSEMFLENIVKISNITRTNPVLAQQKMRRERERLDMEEEERLAYNEKITMKELRSVLATCKETSLAHDEFTYEMIRHGSQEMMQLILQLFNFIFEHRQFPKSWKYPLLFQLPNWERIQLTLTITDLWHSQIVCASCLKR